MCDCDEWFLTPLLRRRRRKQRRRNDNNNDDNGRKRKRPFSEVANDVTSAADTSNDVRINLSNHIAIGRRELIEGTRRACGCSSRQQQQQLFYCNDCVRTEQWAMQFISRHCLKLLLPQQQNNERKQQQQQWLEITGTNSQWLVHVNHKQLHSEFGRKTKKGAWKYVVPLQEGMIISFNYNDDNSNDYDDERPDDGDGGDVRVASSSILEFQLLRGKHVDDDDNHGSVSIVGRNNSNNNEVVEEDTVYHHRHSKRTKTGHNDGDDDASRKEQQRQVLTGTKKDDDDVDAVGSTQPMRPAANHHRQRHDTSSLKTNDSETTTTRMELEEEHHHPPVLACTSSKNHDNQPPPRRHHPCNDTSSKMSDATLELSREEQQQEEQRMPSRPPPKESSTFAISTTTTLDNSGGPPSSSSVQDKDHSKNEIIAATVDSSPSSMIITMGEEEDTSRRDNSMRGNGIDYHIVDAQEEEEQQQDVVLGNTQDLMDYLDRDIQAQQEEEDRLLFAVSASTSSRQQQQLQDRSDLKDNKECTTTNVAVMATETSAAANVTTSTSSRDDDEKKASGKIDGSGGQAAALDQHFRSDEAPFHRLGSLDTSTTVPVGGKTRRCHVRDEPKRPSKESLPIELLSDDGSDVHEDNHSAPTIDGSTTANKQHISNDNQFKILFVKGGSTMTSRMIVQLKQRAKQRGAIVVESLDDRPTHIVLDAHVKVGTVVSALKFRNAKKLVRALDERNILTAKRDWIISGPDKELKRPTLDQLWNGLASIQSEQKVDGGEASKSKQTGAQDSRLPPRRSVTPYVINKKLSDHFHKLSKLQQECALSTDSPFKAYMLNLQAGRLRYLDFEVSLDNVERLEKVKGMGGSAIRTVKEYLKTGGKRCTRTEAYDDDEQRKAMRTLKRIWGVGQSAAEGLYKNGYRTIDQVRRDLKSGDLTTLTANQKIGVANYEVFQEKMGREEVEKIADIVTKVVLEYYPEATVDIMGSYRRGKDQCGDVDLLITDPGYLKTTPRGALGKIADRLKGRGHISHHLTHLEGMTFGSNDSQSSYASSQEEIHRPSPTVSVDDKESSASYMGVFHSPCELGKKRRIDIKFYPYRERVFASLYFTGNGWFNRSMRLWARRAKNLSLNDHGFFPMTPAKTAANAPAPPNRIHVKASTEREVFEYLELVYKDPTDRNFFDDVIPLDPSETWELSQADLKQEDEL